MRGNILMVARCVSIGDRGYTPSSNRSVELNERGKYGAQACDQSTYNQGIRAVNETKRPGAPKAYHFKSTSKGGFSNTIAYVEASASPLDAADEASLTCDHTSDFGGRTNECVYRVVVGSNTRRHKSESLDQGIFEIYASPTSLSFATATAAMASALVGDSFFCA